MALLKVANPGTRGELNPRDLEASMKDLVQDLARVDRWTAGGQTYLAANLNPPGLLRIRHSEAFRLLVNRIRGWVKSNGIDAEVVYDDPATTVAPGYVAVRFT